MVATRGLLRRLVGSVEPAEIDWEAVYEQELGRVFNYFRYRVADGPTAEDLTSETFVKAWRGRSGYREDRGKVSSWLLAIARNVAIDHYRRHQPQVPLETAPAPSTDSTPERLLLRRAELERLSALLRALPERERELIALKYGAEASNREIAGLTQLSESNVGTILHRTVLSLRARWHEEGGDP
jgi:RNA polymerase sigma-70 factor (ECF subfamily)